MLLRLAHMQNYIALSPGNQQVASQPAMECIPLVMEPESGFYADPVIVLDFQSLYPSMIIAYNLCFCTCLGKVVPSKAYTLGVSSYLPEPQLLMDLKDQLLLTPSGVMYVPSKVLSIPLHELHLPWDITSLWCTAASTRMLRKIVLPKHHRNSF
ncbi:hypothetical protein GIB67_006814 [Kingdonia uniflora]|uniref:DNA-directed DNA polymerase n=1 Tax=Kingdonia uniflora TaxID=39325 RepID=A0A7J7L037_9MAGN|nr:hypothetical protein GIB67_006814 [Kingdonia uniflora]